MSVDGRRVRRSLRDRHEAVEVRRATRRALRQHRAYVPLREVFQRQLVWMRLHTKPNSITSAASRFACLEAHFGPTFNTVELTEASLNQYKVSRLDAGVQPITVNHDLRALKAALRRAARPGGVLREVPVAIDFLTVEKRLPRVLSEAELRHLLDTASAPLPPHRGNGREMDPARLGLLVLLGAWAGLRQQEMLHLTAADVLPGAVRVVGKACPACVGGRWAPKTHEERVVPVKPGGRLAVALGARQQQQQDGWLFPGYEGGPIQRANKATNVLWKAAGLYVREERPGLHQLRRTWASRLLKAGVDIQTLKELGGWSNLATLEHYLRADDEQRTAAIAALPD